MTTSSVLSSHDASPQAVSQTSANHRKPLGEFLLGMVKEGGTKNPNGFGSRRRSVDQLTVGVGDKLRAVPPNGARRGSVGEIFLKSRRGSVADSLLLSLRATPLLSRQDEAEEDEGIFLQVHPPSSREKQKKTRIRDFLRKVMRNSERPFVNDVIDLGSSFEEFRRTLSVIPRDFSDAFKEDGRVLVGEGANGRVFSFTRASDQRRYAVKIFTDEVQEGKSEHNTRLYRSFMREAVIGSVLSHAFCGVTYDVGFHGGHLALIMEHYPLNFVRLVNSGKAPALQLNHHFRQLITGIHYLHENGIVHRDLKLENLCLSRAGELKIIDFGNAVLFVPPGPARCSDIAGTDQYIAPEMVRGGAYDAIRSDMWSLGILYLAMLFRKLPWSLPHTDQPSYTEFLKAPVTFMAQFHPWGSDYIPKKLVLRMLDPIPETRLTLDELMDTPWYSEMITI